MASTTDDIEPGNSKSSATNISEGIGADEDSGFASVNSLNCPKKDDKNSEVSSTVQQPESKPEVIDEAPIKEKSRDNTPNNEPHALQNDRDKSNVKAALRKEAEEEFNRKKREKTYKRLMHLLNKSKFFSKVILDKVNDNDKEVSPKKSTRNLRNRQKRKLSRPSNDHDDYYPPKRSRPAVRNNQRYNLREFISDDIEKQVKNQQEQMDSTQEDPKEVAPFIAPKYFVGDLYPYQQEGLQWLKVLFENGLNGILADEMGLGKTIQVIALFAYLIEIQQKGPFLVVVPLSTVPNWMMEFEKFSPQLPIVLYYGTPEERKAAARKINRKFSIEGYLTQPIVITTYEVLKKDEYIFAQHTWCHIVLDEGQRIKNFKSQISQCVQRLKSLNRLILTGTPLQNDLTELWSLLHFLLPDIFDDLDVFESWFDVKELQEAEGAEKILEQEKEKHVISSMREILKPFMMRRMKRDVSLKIPEKKEIIVYAPMTQLQRDLYAAALNRDIEILYKKKNESLIIPDDENGRRPKRKCEYKNKYSTAYADPFDLSCVKSEVCSTQVESSQDDAREELINSWKKYGNITESNCEFVFHLPFGNRIAMYREIVNHPYIIHCPLDDAGLPSINDELVTTSGKLMVLDAMLTRLHADGHKVLVFSTMTKILDIIGDYLNLRPWKYCRLDGSVNVEDRKVIISQFNTDNDIFLFLITTRSGGVGLNLAAADTVIIYDSDWNPQVDIQAMARCHRIGQTRPVVIYRLCTKATLDETIIKRANAKRKLEKMVINEDVGLSLNNPDTLLELKRLLDSSETDGVTYAENGAFTEEELDKLMDRSDLLEPAVDENTSTT